MSTRPREQVSVPWHQVAAFRLGRHHLLERAPAQALISVAGDMTGAQAQLLSAAHLSLWARVQDLTLTQIEEAMRKRRLVKAACMRRTLFLVPSRDLAVFVRGSARRAEKEIRWTRRKGVPDRVIEAAIEAALGALDEPRTRTEIAERASRTLGAEAQAIQGGGWGSRRQVAAVPVGHLTFPVVDLLHLAAARGVICYGPSRGNEPTFVRADAWIPQWKDVPQEEAERRLLRKYLQAFGPSTPADFAMWAGITLTEARAIWEHEQSGLVAVDVEGWQAAVLRRDMDVLMGAGSERPPIRLLPYFDTFLLGHRERDHLMDRAHRPSVYRPQGWVAPVVLVDGRAVAVWEYAWQGDRLQVNVTSLTPLSRRIHTGLQKEARDLGQFLGAQSVDVMIR